MVRTRLPRVHFLAAVSYYCLLSQAAAHGHEPSEMAGPQDPTATVVLETYATTARVSAAWLQAHIAFMVLAWTIALPIATMVGTSRKLLTVVSHSAFIALNGLGFLSIAIYNTNAPDLYSENAHSKIGWIVTFVALLWSALVALSASTQPLSADASKRETAHKTTRYAQLLDDERNIRWSGESDLETERNSTSQIALTPDSEDLQRDPIQEHKLRARSEGARRSMTACLRHISGNVHLRVTDCLRVALEPMLILSAFLALTTGLLTWLGLFRHDGQVNGFFNGLAHWIKGGIFFWYGILTLGRWMGAFSDLGWAWNLKPRAPYVSRFAERIPSAEFTESFVIFVYGATNIFLERLNAPGAKWSMVDLEHVSITIMFLGGGLLGMMIESKTARRLFRTDAATRRAIEADEKCDELLREPKSHRTSLNPVPAMVIMALGVMMSSHHQSSMVSTMLHAQWGSLFVGFALARAATYILLYLSPPTSFLPNRPPSEIVAAFCLMAGGLIFMASARDVVKMLEANGLGAMFAFTVMVGLTFLVMAWAMALFALRRWARET